MSDTDTVHVEATREQARILHGMVSWEAQSAGTRDERETYAALRGVLAEALDQDG